MRISCELRRQPIESESFTVGELLTLGVSLSHVVMVPKPHGAMLTGLSVMLGHPGVPGARSRSR